jgi:hypothetical protein
MRTWIVWLLVCWSSVAWAGKPKIAILGLEIQGGIDSESTRVAQDFAVALRTRPRAGHGPYQWSPGSEKELIDEKLLNGCEPETTECMARIGRNLGADVLVYGRIERKSLGGQAGYQITLKLLDVGKLTQLGWTEFIPLSESSGTKLQDWARKGYKKLTNDYDGGTLLLVVKNEGFDRGTILIDGEERGNIVSGRGEVSSLPEGRYKMSVMAGGYRRWDSEDKIAIRNGETTTEEITLVKLVGDAALCDPTVSTCDPPLPEPKRGRGCAGCGASNQPTMIAALAMFLVARRRRRS